MQLRGQVQKKPDYLSNEALLERYNKEVLDDVQKEVCEQVRHSLWAYRQYMDPNLKKGWWPCDVSDEIQKFYISFKKGERPVLIIQAPPQHGKSRAVTDGIAWMAGMDPKLRFIYASYSNRLGIRANKTLQRMWDDPRHQKAFPEHRIGGDQIVTLANKPQRNSSLIEFVGTQGSFYNTTVNGQVTGLSSDIGIVDDPMKGRKEASNVENRDKVWDWLMDDFRTRMSDMGGLIIMMTRWNEDDPIGRAIKAFPNAVVLNYPAIANEDGYYRDAGEALFPEFKSLEFLKQQQMAMAASSWESLYQQNPTAKGGDLFPIGKIEVLKTFPKNRIKNSVRYWDKAGTKDGGAYTAGILMHEMDDAFEVPYVVSDVVRGQWSALEREQRIKQVAQLDRNMYKRVHTWIEQEPGSGGKESAESTIRNLRGFNIKAERPVGDKYFRAEPFGAQVQAGNVAVVMDEKWNKHFLDELEVFPNGTYKDQVDAASAAFAKLASKLYRYDGSLNWVRERR